MISDPPSLKGAKTYFSPFYNLSPFLRIEKVVRLTTSNRINKVDFFYKKKKDIYLIDDSYIDDI